MIKVKPSFPKLNKSTPKHRSVLSSDSENVKPLVFNTKGYFDPSQPLDEEYFKAKQKVFEKYRNKEEEYVMVDLKNTNKSAFIQRGCLMPIKEANGPQDETTFLEKARNSLLKNYLMRKERREHIDLEKYVDPPKINTEILQSRNTINSRTHTRQISSRDSVHSYLRSESDF